MTRVARILILDDEPGVSHAITLLVKMFGYQGVECHSPAEALHLMADGTFDLLITDYRMPKMNGLELVSHLRTNRCWVPIILMTAFSANIDTKKAAQLGINTIMHKPFDSSELKQTLESMIGEPLAHDKDPQKLAADLCEEWAGYNTPSSKTEG